MHVFSPFAWSCPCRVAPSFLPFLPRLPCSSRALAELSQTFCAPSAPPGDLQASSGTPWGDLRRSPAISGRSPAISGRSPAISGRSPAISGDLWAISGDLQAITGRSVPIFRTIFTRSLGAESRCTPMLSECSERFPSQVCLCLAFVLRFSSGHYAFAVISNVSRYFGTPRFELHVPRGSALSTLLVPFALLFALPG